MTPAMSTFGPASFRMSCVRMPVAPLVLRAADLARDARRRDYDAARRRTGNVWQDDPFAAPFRIRVLAVERLPRAEPGRAFQAPDRVAAFGEVEAEQHVAFQVGLDRVEQVDGRALGRADDLDELLVPVERDPLRRAEQQRRLPVSARHRLREELPLERRPFDFPDHGQVVRRPRERKVFGEVSFTEQPQVRPARRLALRVRDGRERRDVARRGRLRLHDRVRLLAPFLGRLRAPLRLRPPRLNLRPAPLFELRIRRLVAEQRRQLRA